MFKDVNLEAEAAATLAIAMLKNDGSADALATARSRTPTPNETSSRVFATPVWVTQDNIKAPFDAGYTTVAKVCTATLAADCTKLGLS